jgi:hypothetical protein
MVVLVRCSNCGIRNGESSIVLGKEFGVHSSTILRIVKFERYKHATCELFGEYFPKTAEERLKMESKK